MLISLFVKDFAVVHEAELGFGPGLSVISGETGAGKSLLVDALMLLSGARADAAMVRHGAERAELAAGFDLSDAPAARDWLAAEELDDEGQCQLRRVIRADGGSRAWINGRPATVSQQAALGSLLLEIHGQHEHQALLDRGHQLDLLDAFGGHVEALEEVRGLAREHAATQRELESLPGGEAGRERLEWIERRLEELSREELSPEAVESLLEAHRRQANAATLLSGYGRAIARLGEDDEFALASGLRRLQHELAELASHEPALAPLLDMLESVAIQLDEAQASLERLRDDLDLDPARLEQLEARIAHLHELSRRHRVGMSELGPVQASLETEAERLRDAEGSAVALRRRLEDTHARWREAAARLGAKRAEAGRRLGEAVEALLAELGMGQARFAVQLDANSSAGPDPNGSERAEFMVALNPGQPASPLRGTASGGELSRIGLAIEVASLGADPVPTMVFDEVDTGIGGAVAEAVGARLRALGERPQVAAQGHAHYHVSKASEAEATRSRVQRLDENARVEEIARMLAGREVSKEARAQARRLLGIH
jgi:DNA repair protein RecN (Recombination protein N)